MKKYTDGILILISVIIAIILISNLYLSNQKILTNQKYCLDYYQSVNFGFTEAIIECQDIK